MRSINRRTTSMAIVAGVVASLLGVASSAQAEHVVVCEDASLQGCWTAPFSENDNQFGGDNVPSTAEDAAALPTAVSAAVTPSGRVVYWDGLSGLEQSNGPLILDAGRSGQKRDRSRLLDLSGPEPSWQVPTPEDGAAPDNLFCADQRLLADGRVLIAGGTKYQTEPHADLPDEVFDPEAGAPDGLAELWGSANTRFYEENPEGGTWTWEDSNEDGIGDADMNWRRWYPSTVTLPDGRVLAASGVSKLLWNSSLVGDGNPKNSIEELPVNVKQVEVFDPVTERWTDYATPESEQSLPLYPRLHLLPSGEVFYSADGQMWGPAGEDINELGWINQKIFDPVAGEWRDVNMGPYGARNGAISVLLPLRPNDEGEYDTAEILVSGGTLGVSPGLYLGTTLSEKITLSDSDSDGAWEATSEEAPQLNNARWFSSGVLLPNGEVLIFSGGDKDEVIMPGTEAAVRTPELFDGESWTELPDGGRDRTYHNSAILLPDGSVLVGGHSPINALYGPTADNSLTALGFASNVRDPSFEIYYPPYLFAGDRPEILEAAASGTYGQPLPFVTNEDEDIAQVVLSRLPAQTHTVDADQRTVEVPVDGPHGDGEVANWHAMIPDNPAVLPPGYYYLFALSSEDVPSHAAIVCIGGACPHGDEENDVIGQSMVAPIEIATRPPRAELIAGTPAKALARAGETALDGSTVRATSAGGSAAGTEPRLPVALLVAGLAGAMGIAARRRATRALS